MPGLEEKRAPYEAPAARAKLFQHGGSQAVRLPRAFRFDGAEVTVRREGEAVILEPVKVKRPRTDEEWNIFWAEIDRNSGADFPDREQPPMQERDYEG